MAIIILLLFLFTLLVKPSYSRTIDSSVNKTHIYAPGLDFNPVQSTPNGGKSLIVRAGTASDTLAIAKLIKNSQASSSPNSLDGVISNSNVVVATLDDNAFNKVLSSYGTSTLKVEYNYLYTQSSILTQNPCTSWGLARISTRKVYSPGTPYDYTSCMQKVYVYVVDTGVDVSNSEFEGRATSIGNFTPEPTGVDGNGHGTLVAGLIAGKTTGVAKKAEILSVKVIDSTGMTDLATILAGLDLIVTRLKAVQQQNQNYQNVAYIVNLSLAGPRSDIFNTVIETIYSLNAFVTAAAGNGYGGDACQISPASSSRAFSVAASDKADKQAYFSNCGSCVNAFAPGEDVPSVSLSGGFANFSGTSISAPLVAGIAALYACSKSYWNVVDITNDLINRSAQGAINGVCPGTTRRMVYNRQ